MIHQCIVTYPSTYMYISNFNIYLHPPPNPRFIFYFNITYFLLVTSIVFVVFVCLLLLLLLFFFFWGGACRLYFGDPRPQFKMSNRVLALWFPPPPPPNNLHVGKQHVGMAMGISLVPLVYTLHTSWIVVQYDVVSGDNLHTTQW